MFVARFGFDVERISRLWLNIVLLGECMIMGKIDVHVFLTISGKNSCLTQKF